MKKYCLLVCSVVVLFLACDSDDPKPIDMSGIDDRIEANYDPQSYALDVPEHLPILEVPADNEFTIDGVELGRHLFYDPILSLDSTVACASCHLPELGFSDKRPVSLGVGNAAGTRNSMSLANVGFYTRGLFWDGRVRTLEEQALEPVENHLEMNEEWEHVLAKLRRHPDYPALFRKAFGIENRSDITRELAAKALSQFERILISGNSRFDQAVFENSIFLEDEEINGQELFFVEFAGPSLNHPGCSHCHGGPLFTDNRYLNNGLDSVASLSSFMDLGRGAVTGRIGDNGRFRVPTLRNIALTAPYMHDGRFETLEEVVDHYASGGHFADNLDANIRPFTLTDTEKEELIAFLHTLTDEAFVNNPAIQNPFK